MINYKGKEPCQGCGRTGIEKPRDSKDCLCYDCQQALNIGRAIIRERNLERDNFRMDDMKMAFMQRYAIPISKVDSALRKLLFTFSQFDERNVGSNCVQNNFLAGRADSGTAHDNFILPKITFDAAKELCQEIENMAHQIRKEREELENEMQERLRKERNDIYNAGVAHGRDLLCQLNNGEITSKDLEKYITRY